MSKLDEAIAEARGVTALAAGLGVVQSTVSNWRARGGQVPVDHCAGVERLSNRKVMRWDLRPNDWHRIWPELVGTPGAPEPTQVEASGAA